MRQFRRLVEQARQIEAGADATDRAGQDVIEHQRRDGELGKCSAHRLVHDTVNAAAHEHGRAFHVDAADGVAEQHDAQDEPGRRLADGLFGDAAGVKGRRTQVAQNDGGRPPERDERQHDGRGDDNFRRPQTGV